jgi:hypothetical protein
VTTGTVGRVERAHNLKGTLACFISVAPCWPGACCASSVRFDARWWMTECAGDVTGT